MKKIQVGFAVFTKRKIRPLNQHPADTLFLVNTCRLGIRGV